tara:strand:- start:1081 stop:1203 length:123 start_codon:yes stop_codon:yes gene_type:complete
VQKVAQPLNNKYNLFFLNAIKKGEILKNISPSKAKATKTN